MLKTYNVHYSFYMSDSVKIKANNEKEAEEKVKKMICNGQLGDDLNEMEVAESKVWID